MEIPGEPIQLVEQARQGHPESLELLAGQCRPRLEEYVFRLTLDRDLTGDIVQECMLNMVKLLGKLEHSDRFWPWLRRMAFNKLCDTRKAQIRQKKMNKQLAQVVTIDRPRQLSEMVSKELSEAVLKCMYELKPQHRQVLTLRCYEQLGYEEIAEVMERSEFGVRMLFCRAKRSLKRQLGKQGLGKGSLLTALIVFGKLTAKTEASMATLSISAGTLNAGLAAGTLTGLAGKTAITTITAAGILAVGTGVAIDNYQQSESSQSPMKYVKTESGDTAWLHNDLKPGERWYFFPEGSGGPVMSRSSTTGSKGKEYCNWLQNEERNCHFDRKKNTIYITNYHYWDQDTLSVMRLPGDGREMFDFLNQVEGRQPMNPILSEVNRNEWIIMGVNKNKPYASRLFHQHLLKEEAFQNPWPADLAVVDIRDTMHKRGWTYFRISGHIGEKNISGMGQVPFVYSKYVQRRPWLRILVNYDFEIVDQENGAYILKPGGDVASAYPSGSFFKGLVRPWMGLHTLDTVRRDAAEQGLDFATQIDDQGAGKVTITNNKGRLTYFIDMESDVIEKIRFNAGIPGEIQFEYLQEIEGIEDTFIKPDVNWFGSKDKGLGMSWLFILTNE
ncbi:MAG: RNA polymerase sigma factor [Sedimentisphaerales bacterium]|nr:RNA polymerase sigma factor [Sedimentisphaerales bacterium]